MSAGRDCAGSILRDLSLLIVIWGLGLSQGYGLALGLKLLKLLLVMLLVLLRRLLMLLIRLVLLLVGLWMLLVLLLLVLIVLLRLLLLLLLLLLLVRGEIRGILPIIIAVVGVVTVHGRPSLVVVFLVFGRVVVVEARCRALGCKPQILELGPLICRSAIFLRLIIPPAFIA